VKLREAKTYSLAKLTAVPVAMIFVKVALKIPSFVLKIVELAEISSVMSITVKI